VIFSSARPIWTAFAGSPSSKIRVVKKKVCYMSSRIALSVIVTASSVLGGDLTDWAQQPLEAVGCSA